MLIFSLTNIGLDILNGFVTLLWPSRCVCCGVLVSQELDGLCRDCWDGIMYCTGGDYCKRCGRDASVYGIIQGRCGACQDIETAVDGVARGGVYSGALRDIILAFKFHDRTELEDIISLPTSAALAGSGFADRIDYFVPVPLHWMRRLVRGYNQSLLICKSLKERIAPVNTDLVRIRNTKRQWHLTAAGRRKNVKGAFAVRKGHDFAGKAICLVDDITTSGATLEECAKALRQAGALKVYALVTAVAMQDVD